MFKAKLILLLIPVNIISNTLTTVFNEKPQIKQNEEEVFDVEKCFKHYNPNIEDSIIDIFNEVIEVYDLVDYKETLVKQICLESSARQYYNDDSVITSSGNAVGITQITPYTAQLYFENVLQYNDTIIKYINDYSYILEFGDSKRCEIINWLSDVKNNMYLYAFMMKYNIDKYKNIDKALVVYAKGDYYLSKCQKVDTVNYIVMLNEINHNQL